MKKSLFYVSVLLCSTFSFAQVGINTPQPKATLDVQASETDITKTDGIIAPRLTGDQLKAKDILYTDDLKGTMVYITTAANPVSAKTINVNSAGFYYYDGAVWVKINSGSFNGDPTSDAFIDDAANTMVKLGASSSGGSRIANSDFVIKDNGNVGIGTTAPSQKLEVSGNGKFESGNTQVDIISSGVNPANIHLIRNNNRTNLSNEDLIGYFNFNGRVNGTDNTPLATIVSKYQGNGTGNESSIDFRTSGTSGADMMLDENGNLGIGTTLPSEKLEVNGNGKFTSGNTKVEIISSGSNAASISLTKNNNGSNVTNASLIGFLNFNGRVNGNDNIPLSTIVSTYEGNGIGTESAIDFRTSGISNVDMKLDQSGNLGIATTLPTQKLDVDGNARFRNVPDGSLASSDKYLAISNNGTLKKVDIGLPALGLFATTTNSESHASNGDINNLNFNNVGKINNNYLIATAYPNTFKVMQYGLYTIEVWGKFSVVPPDSNDSNRGCTLVITAGGANNNVQSTGDRWVAGAGASNIAKTVILNANEEISVYTRCTRTNSPNYTTGPNSSIFITYTPL